MGMPSMFCATVCCVDDKERSLRRAFFYQVRDIGIQLVRTYADRSHLVVVCLLLETYNLAGFPAMMDFEYLDQWELVGHRLVGAKCVGPRLFHTKSG
jgi:hypothetical protein